MASIDLVNDNPNPSEDEVREGIEGNLCRCTGYQNIVRAVQQAAAEMNPTRSAGMTVTEDRPAPQAPAKEVGKARRRKEDARLITGQTTWTDNMVLPGMLHLAVVRSPVAHAQDHQRRPQRGPAGARASSPSSPAATSPRSRARSRARGRSRRTWSTPGTRRSPSRRSTTSVRPSRSSSRAARRPRRTPSSSSTSTTTRCRSCSTWRRRSGRSRTSCHDHLASNESFRFVFDAGEAGTGVDTEQAFADADVVVSRRFVQQRLIPAFMEPRSVVVQPQGDNYTMWSSTQVPHILRLMLAMVTGTPGAQAAGHRPRRRRRLRRQAAGHARGGAHACWWPSGWASRSSGPRPAASR